LQGCDCDILVDVVDKDMMRLLPLAGMGQMEIMKKAGGRTVWCICITKTMLERNVFVLEWKEE
jgi:hypothetical protein